MEETSPGASTTTGTTAAFTPSDDWNGVTFEVLPGAVAGGAIVGLGAAVFSESGVITGLGKITGVVDI